MAGIVGLTEIQHQNGTSAMTIDANGRMSKGVQVFWVLGYNGNSQVEGTLVFDYLVKLQFQWLEYICVLLRVIMTTLTCTLTLMDQIHIVLLVSGITEQIVILW